MMSSRRAMPASYNSCISAIVELRRLAYRSSSVGTHHSLNCSRSANSSGNLGICVVLLVVQLGGLGDVLGSVPVGLGFFVPVDVLMCGHVQVAQQDLLVAQWEVRDHPGVDHALCGFQGVGVLECVLLERHRGQFLGQPLPGVLR